MSLGPGDASHMTPACSRALCEAQAVVGYTGYIDLIPQDILHGKTVLSTGMTGEVERVNRAVDLACDGPSVALVSSGDAGIYAMAGLALEVIEERDLLDVLDFAVLPGVPALAAAAALLGAPLMHDFACVSLSDLLTPWEVIERRVLAAASADFVLVLYNPRSRRRSGHLDRALDLVRRHRGPDTPVGIVGRAFRPGQSVHVARLDQVQPADVDMQSIVIVGNASTRFCGSGMLTPRGYGAKYDLSGQ